MHLFSAFCSNSKHVFRGSRGALTHYNESVFSLKARPCVDGLHCLRESFFFFLDTTGRLDKVQGGHRFLCVCVPFSNYRLLEPISCHSYRPHAYVVAKGKMKGINQTMLLYYLATKKHARWVNNKHSCADLFMLCLRHFIKCKSLPELYR